MNFKKIAVIVMALVMVIGMGGCSKSPDSKVASINDQEITYGEVEKFTDIYAYIQGYDPSNLSNESKQAMLQDYVDMNVMKQYMDGQGKVVIDDYNAAEIDGNIETAHEGAQEFMDEYGITDDDLRNFYELQKYSEYFLMDLTTELKDRDLDEEAQAYYDANKETEFKITEDQANLSDILVTDEDTANMIMEQLQMSGDIETTFYSMATQYSVGTTAEDGGALGYVAVKKSDKGDDYDAAVATLQDGELSAVIKANDGYHILYCTGRKTAGEYESFDDSYETIYYDIYQAEYDKKMAEIKETMDVEVGKM